MIDSKDIVQLLGNRNLAEWYTMNPDKFPQMADSIIASAGIPEGYENVTWQACTQLFTTDVDRDRLLNECVVPAVALALQTAMTNTEWYKALAFLGLPWSDDVPFETFLNNSDLKDLFTCRTISPTSWQLSAETLQSLSPDRHHQLVTFLTYMPQLCFPLSVRHQLSAALLTILDPSTDDFARVSKVFLGGLTEGKLSGLAFVIWRSLADVSPGVATESLAALYLRDYIEIAQENKVELLDLIVRLAGDEMLLQICDSNADLCIGLGALAFFGIQLGGNDTLHATLFRLLDSIGTWAPNAVEAIRIRLAAQQTSNKRFGSDSELYSQTLSNLRALLNSRKTYRGLPLAQEIWRYNLDYHFDPILQALCSETIPDAWMDAVEQLTAEELVKGCVLQRESIHPIEGSVLADLIRDTQEAVDVLRQARDIVSRNPSVLRPSVEDTDSDYLLDVDMKRLAAIGPFAAWAVDRFLRKSLCAD